jgi:DNA-directed RNA polymerase specialized sigma24 family protein
MIHLASGLTDAVGNAFYQEFIRRGVVGMPPVNGEDPGTGTKAPPGYGKRFGERLYAILLGKSRNVDTVEEALSVSLTQLAEGKLGRISPGFPLRDAEQYVTRMALNNQATLWRKGRNRSNEDINDRADLTDPNSFKNLDTLLPHTELTQLLQDLEKVNSRAPLWLEAKLDGLSSVEIASEWGVGKSAVANWEKQYIPKIKRVVLRYLQEAA